MRGSKLLDYRIVYLLVVCFLIPLVSHGKTEEDKVVLGYVLDRYTTLPDPNLLTHLIYGFADFNETYDRIRIKYPERLKSLSSLKKQNPKLKVILGISSSRREGYSEMCSDDSKRRNFAKSCKQVLQDYNLDGIDLDWEFPTTEAGGHTASPDDKENYVLFVKMLRSEIGKDKWISIYSNNTGGWIDFDGMIPYLSYVNVSGYNLDCAPLHHSNLYPSNICGSWSISKVIERHRSKGIPYEKMLLGIPFFGRCKSPLPSYVEYKDFFKFADGYTYEWDVEACAPFLKSADGMLAIGFDNEKSIKYKCDYIKDIGLSGVFYWHYDADDNNNSLAKAIANELIK